ncbi:protoporphyrinogen oxidase HemJ [Poseidonocella sedimentorum]|nr:protoporphyrinogen oxidase HemJ [Poseidonocella sedimentorum]
MFDLLLTAYPWVKSLHVISVIAWMAGLFYLPRLFVYHVEKVESGSETDALFQTMERKLFRVIMQPAMMASWTFGLIMVFTPGAVDWGAIWPYTKGFAILSMTAFHDWLGRRVYQFSQGTNQLTGRRYRIMNEVPTVLLVIIIFSVIVRF